MSLLIFVGPNTTPDVDYYVDRYDRSILFEPGLAAYDELTIRYAARHEIQIINAGCGDTTGTFNFREYNDGLSSSFAVVTEEAKQVFSRATWGGKLQQAAMVNLGEWLSEHGIELIDMLIIDAQGFDYTILKTIEPILKKQAVKRLRTEADHKGFSHYEIENTFDRQRELLESCDYLLTNKVGSRHLDLTWEPMGNETEIIARLERTFCGLHD